MQKAGRGQRQRAERGRVQKQREGADNGRKPKRKEKGGRERKAMRGLRWQLAWRLKTSRTWARTLQHPHRQSRAAYIAARQAARLGLLIKIDAYIEQLHAIAMRGSEAEPVATNYGFDQN